MIHIDYDAIKCGKGNSIKFPPIKFICSNILKKLYNVDREEDIK